MYIDFLLSDLQSLKVFGLKRDKVMGEWRKLHSDGLDALYTLPNTGRFVMFSVITNIYNKKTKGPTLMKLFTATGKLKTFFFLTTRDARCVHHG